MCINMFPFLCSIFWSYNDADMCKKSVWGFWSCYKKAHSRLRMKAWILTMWQLFATTISTSFLQICVIRTCRSTPMITKIEVSSPQSAADTSYIVPMSLVSCSCNERGSWIWPPTKTLLLCFLQADWYLICVISGLWAERQQACCEISRQDSSRHGHFQNCPQVWRHARWECWVSVCWRHTQRCYLRINTENRETYLPDSAKLHIATNSWQTAFFHASFSRVVGLQTHSEKTQTESCCAEKQLQHTTPNKPEKLSLHVCYCVVQTNVTHWD